MCGPLVERVPVVVASEDVLRIVEGVFAVRSGFIAGDGAVRHTVVDRPGFGVCEDMPVPGFVSVIIVGEVVFAAEGAKVFGFGFAAA